ALSRLLIDSRAYSLVVPSASHSFPTRRSSDLVQCAPASVSSPAERVASADTRRGARIAGRPWRRIQRARPARGAPRAVPRRATARDGGHRGTGERRARRAWRAHRGTAEPPAHRADRPRGRSDPTDRPREVDAQPPRTTVRTAHARPVSQTPPGRLMSGALGPGALVWAGFDGERAPGALLDAVHDGRVGGILLFAFRKNIRSKEQVRAMLREVQEAARRGGLPPVPVAVDQEGGTVVRVAYRAVFPSAMASAAKHFPGHGATTRDSPLHMPEVAADTGTLERRELVPFRAAIAAGASMVMTAHVRYPALDPAAPATISRPILTGLLRNELGF